MKKRLLFSCIAFALLLCAEYGWAAATTYDWTGAISTDWSTPGNWKVGAVVATFAPGHATSDVVRIGSSVSYSGNEPVLNGIVTIATLTIGNGTSVLPILTINAALTTSGTTTVNTGSTVITTDAFNPKTLIINGGTLTLGGTVTVTTLTFSSGTTLINNTPSVINISGNLLVSAGTVTLGAPTNVTGTFKITGVSNLNAAFTCGAITVNSGSTLASNTDGTITGSSTMALTGTLSLGNALNLTGALTVNSGSIITTTAGATISATTLTIIGSTLTLGDAVTLSSTSTSALKFTSGTTTLSGTSAVNIPNGGLTISGGTVTLGAPTNVGGTVTVTGLLTLNAALTSGAITVSSTKKITSNAGGTINAASMDLTGNTITLNDVLTLGGDLTSNGTGACTLITNAMGNAINGNITLVTAGNTLNWNGTGGSTTVGTINISSKSDVNIGSGNTVTFGAISMTAGTGTAGNTSKLTNAGTVLCTGATSMPNFTSIINSGTFSLGPSSVTTINGNASTIINNTGTFTLMSDATGSATIAEITAGSLTGNFVVQRFITGGSSSYRGYRLLSSPVNAIAGFYDMSFLKGSGSYLTGAGGTGSGFDIAGNPTIYLYREDIVPSNASFSAGNYRAITAINNSPAYSIGTIDGNFNMPVGNGFLFFFRGNNSTNPSIVPSNITLNTSGSLNQGQITVKDWFNYSSGNLAYSTTSGTVNVEGFNLVGNPYPSSVDWHTIYGNITTTSGICCSTNMSNTIYVYNTTTKNYSTYLNTSATTGSGTNGGSNIIPAGQGFFAQATGTGAQLIFNESAKVSSQPATLLLNAAAVAPVDRHLRLRLVKDSVNKDGTVIIFNDKASDTYKQDEDAIYLKGSGVVSLSNMSKYHIPQAISQLPFPKTSQTIQLNVNAASSGTYSLNLAEATNIPDMYDVWLKDAYLKDSLDIKHNPAYGFTINTGDTATYSSNRLSLVIRQNPALAVHLLSFSGTRETGDVKLDCTVENEGNYTHYMVERSTDGGETFSVLDSLTSDGRGSYNALDQNPAKVQNQYRLKQTDINGTTSYSNVVNIMYSTNRGSPQHNSIRVYPNPVVSTLNLFIKTKNDEKTTYKITITSSIGIVVKTASFNQPEWNTNVRKLLPGTYFIQVVNKKTNALLGRSTFIKR